jgi:hypothetical protein
MDEFIEKEVAEGVTQMAYSAIAATARWFKRGRQKQPIRPIKTRSGVDRRRNTERRIPHSKLRLRTGLLHQYYRVTGDAGGAEVSFPSEARIDKLTQVLLPEVRKYKFFLEHCPVPTDFAIEMGLRFVWTKMSARPVGERVILVDQLVDDLVRCMFELFEVRMKDRRSSQDRRKDA